MFNFPPRNQLNFPVLKSQSIGVWKSVSHFSLDLEIQVLITTNSKRNIASVVRFVVPKSELYLRYLAKTLQNLSGRCTLNLWRSSWLEIFPNSASSGKVVLVNCLNSAEQLLNGYFLFNRSIISNFFPKWHN